jgi:type VI secretion system VasD/TssJ family lipoprotein
MKESKMSVRIGKALALGALLGLTLGVCGCSLLGLGGAAKDAISVVGATRLNSCDEPTADHAVVVRIYSLRDAEVFRDAAFDRLWDDRGRALGEVVASVRELTVMPGEPVQEFGLARGKGVTAIGVVADFCDHKSGCWKKVVPLGKGSARIVIRLEKLCLTADKS